MAGMEHTPCGQCGRPVPRGAKLCAYCGATIRRSRSEDPDFETLQHMAVGIWASADHLVDVLERRFPTVDPDPVPRCLMELETALAQSDMGRITDALAELEEASHSLVRRLRR